MYYVYHTHPVLTSSTTESPRIKSLLTAYNTLMCYVYILACNNGTHYTGYSANLKKRIAQHKNGEVFSTKTKLPVELIFYEAFLD